MNSASGATRAVMEGTLAAIRDGLPASLAMVIETSGSTYVRRGAMALFAAGTQQIGWLSGGCLEPEIARCAERAAADAMIAWMEIDTRDDEDLFAGSAVGCRGRLRLVLLPLLAMDGWTDLAEAWLAGEGPFVCSIDLSGQIDCRVAAYACSWKLPSIYAGWQEANAEKSRWDITLTAPPSLVIFGAGPETPVLIPLLRAIGWMTSIAESRPRWQANAELADHRIIERPETAISAIKPGKIQAALVMHHNFEMDREALQGLAPIPIPFIGLLGPNRRRDDLFKVLPIDVRETLLPRLHSPVGMNLGGHGPEAIALSIAAQLQAFMHRQ